MNCCQISTVARVAIPGCAGFAEGVIKGEVKSLSQCRPSAGRKGSREAISEYLENTPGPDGTVIHIK